MNEQRVHQIFEVSLLLKGAHALIECVGGLLLAFVSTSTIVSLVNRLTQEELVEDPHDFIAGHLMNAANHFSVGTQHFYAFYLLSHGLIKIALVVGLLRGKLWAYPASLVALLLFIVYQLYRFSYTRSAGLIVLTIFDLIVIWLIWHEYRLVRRHKVASR
ncbi:MULTISPECIES: DUF2127 domain-containing protein [unclassified Mesorhizobium]|uniref:DUF2127 domain-containing protein n=1 Tax=unclassified Mesorhizobium TaxID=325217 RepID=UPI001094141C|nr:MULTISPECIES: DUF2127 domain-containing protein [unclassified Mesorhizobium]TGS48627.1 DUF2127 domain-containing protein [Mesorhizobium sp. M8A.F.Ca.ET.182.01.1.1]TGS83081.1 DUF2127 domain-containing protein [Mesorhizobium sp. M8A.F.Ca.ET.181.01.1.1]